MTARSIMYCSSLALVLPLSDVASAITHEEILALQKSSAENQQPKQIKPAKYKRVADVALTESSDFLTNGKIWTIVPKNSIIVVPPRLQKNVTPLPLGKFVNWKKFLTKNPAWLSTIEVSADISSGAKTIDYERYKMLESRGQVVVAVHNRGPISVIPEAIIKEKP